MTEHYRRIHEYYDAMRGLSLEDRLIDTLGRIDREALRRMVDRAVDERLGKKTDWMTRLGPRLELSHENFVYREVNGNKEFISHSVYWPWFLEWAVETYNEFNHPARNTAPEPLPMNWLDRFWNWIYAGPKGDLK
jgi:hypothetical protein